jgi:hypothetical protein
MTQEKIDLDLESLVTFLKARGTKASAAALDKMGRSFNLDLRETLTDDDRRHMLYFRQAGVLTAAVEELKEWLGLLDHPKPLDYRLHVLFEFAASTAILARRCINDDLADELLNREQKRLDAANARAGKLAKLQPRDRLILEEAKEILFLNQKRRRWWVAGELLKNKRLTESKGWKASPLLHGGVDALLKKHWRSLSPSLSRRTGRR